MRQEKTLKTWRCGKRQWKVVCLPIEHLTTEKCRQREYKFVFWVVTLCGLLGRYKRFGETHCLNLQGFYKYPRHFKIWYERYAVCRLSPKVIWCMRLHVNRLNCNWPKIYQGFPKPRYIIVVRNSSYLSWRTCGATGYLSAIYLRLG
jgi:hypothetical protein